MNKNKTKLSLVARIVGGTMFVAVLMFNLVSVVQTDTKGISFQTLKAYAQSGGSGNEEENKGVDTKLTTESTEVNSFTNSSGKLCQQSRTVTVVTCSGSGSIVCTKSTTPGDWSTPTCQS